MNYENNEQDYEFNGLLFKQKGIIAKHEGLIAKGICVEDGFSFQDGDEIWHYDESLLLEFEELATLPKNKVILSGTLHVRNGHIVAFKMV